MPAEVLIDYANRAKTIEEFMRRIKRQEDFTAALKKHPLRYTQTPLHTIPDLSPTYKVNKEEFKREARAELNRIRARQAATLAPTAPIPSPSDSTTHSASSQQSSTEPSAESDSQQRSL